jgi:predicted nucleic acid-binding Zn ribbon protein
MRKLTLTDIRLSGNRNVIAAPMWAYKEDKYGWWRPVDWAWSDIRRELSGCRGAHGLSCINGGEPKTCFVCGAEFMGPWGEKHAAVCSEKCYLERRRQTYKQTKQPRPRVSHERRPCARYGEAFTPRRSDARFCSVRCRVAHHRQTADKA